MCDPVSAGIATAIGTAVSFVGSMQQARAAQQNQNAIIAQNRATQVAQNQGFTQRLQAGLQQTLGQTAASRETLSTRAAAADQMRTAQMSSLKNYQDVINAQNEQAGNLRRRGDEEAQRLLQETNQSSLAGAEEQRRRQAAELLSESQPGPEPTDPSGAVGRDPVYGGALARRAAEAATNIRSYGSKIGNVGAYDAPGQQIGLAIQGNKFGIMPAQTAENLLRSGSSTRLLPSQVGYQAATGLGGAQDILLQSRGQGALDAAGLSYGNAVDLANLGQSNAQTIAGNIARQAQADAEARKGLGTMIQGIGNIGLYGAGRFGGLSGLFGGSSAVPGGNVSDLGY